MPIKRRKKPPKELKAQQLVVGIYLALENAGDVNLVERTRDIARYAGASFTNAQASAWLEKFVKKHKTQGVRFKKKRPPSSLPKLDSQTLEPQAFPSKRTGNGQNKGGKRTENGQTYEQQRLINKDSREKTDGKRTDERTENGLTRVKGISSLETGVNPRTPVSSFSHNSLDAEKRKADEEERQRAIEVAEQEKKAKLKAARAEIAANAERMRAAREEVLTKPAPLTSRPLDACISGMSTQSVRTLSENEVREETDEVLKSLRIAIALDKSGSMGEPSIRMAGKTKWEELEETVTAVARDAVAAGATGGLTLIFFSSSAHVKVGVTPDEVKSVFREFHPSGSTNLAAALDEIENIARHSKEDVLGIVYTDGMADDKNAVITAMNKAGNDSGRPHIGFCIIQVGNDQGAKEFLAYVDDNLKIDVSSTVPFADSGELSLAKIAWLARNA